MAKRKKGGRVISVDFTGSTSGGGKKVPDGDYLCRVDGITDEVGNDSGQPYLKWVFEVLEPAKYKGAKLFHNTSLQPQALFNLRNVLEAMEVEVPESMVNLHLDDYIDNELGIGVENELYEGKKKPKPTEFFTVSELFTEDDDDDEDVDDEDDDDEDEDEEEDEDDDEVEYENMTIDELQDLCKEREIKFSKKAKAKKLISLLEEYDEEEDL